MTEKSQNFTLVDKWKDFTCHQIALKYLKVARKMIDEDNEKQVITSHIGYFAFKKCGLPWMDLYQAIEGGNVLHIIDCTYNYTEERSDHLYIELKNCEEGLLSEIMSMPKIHVQNYRYSYKYVGQTHYQVAAKYLDVLHALVKYKKFLRIVTSHVGFYACKQRNSTWMPLYENIKENDIRKIISITRYGGFTFVPQLKGLTLKQIAQWTLKAVNGKKNAALEVIVRHIGAHAFHPEKPKKDWERLYYAIRGSDWLYTQFVAEENPTERQSLKMRIWERDIECRKPIDSFKPNFSKAEVNPNTENELKWDILNPPDIGITSVSPKSTITYTPPSSVPPLETPIELSFDFLNNVIMPVRDSKSGFVVYTIGCRCSRREDEWSKKFLGFKDEEERDIVGGMRLFHQLVKYVIKENCLIGNTGLLTALSHDDERSNPNSPLYKSAKTISTELGLNFLSDSLSKKQHVSLRTLRKRRKREQIPTKIANVYSCLKFENIENVIVLDDFLTSGFTFQEIKRAILVANCNVNIYGVVLAKHILKKEINTNDKIPKEIEDMWEYRN